MADTNEQPTPVAMASRVRRSVPLAPLTTLQLGGPAASYAEATSDVEVADAVRWAQAQRLPLAVLGGGSNVVVADAGIRGLVLRVATRGRTVAGGGDRVLVTAAAGEGWDELAAWTVEQGWAGLECLSGIPGTVGAAPIQNIGAYGQDVGQTIAAVRVLDRSTVAVRDLAAADCSFGYRDSVFRREPDRYVVLGVTFGLAAGGPPTVRYPELARALDDDRPSLESVREAVLALRRSKSMVADPSDPNRRSVGSFFVNPVVDDALLRTVIARAEANGIAGQDVPSYPQPGGLSKLSAAWLIERAGFPRGLRRGAVGLSSKHALALVHHGGGTTGELLGLAREIRDGVFASFGVTLRPEPRFLGFESDPL